MSIVLAIFLSYAYHNLIFFNLIMHCLSSHALYGSYKCENQNNIFNNYIAYIRWINFISV